MNQNTIFFRPLNQKAFQDGKIKPELVTAQAFLPRQQDHPWHTPVYDGDRITPGDLVELFRSFSPGKTQGVAWLSLAQCRELGCKVETSPYSETRQRCDLYFPSPATWERIEELAQRLTDQAVENGVIIYPLP